MFHRGVVQFMYHQCRICFHYICGLFSYQGTVTFTEHNFSLPVTDIRAQIITFKSSGARYKAICRKAVNTWRKGP